MSFHALCPGSLQIWYHLQTDRSPDVFSPALNNLADGRLHRIRIHRVGKNLYVQVSREPPHGHAGDFFLFLKISCGTLQYASLLKLRDSWLHL